jgi:hypothetical protein
MRDSGYWIVLSVGWDRSRPKGRRWDALVVRSSPRMSWASPTRSGSRQRPPRRLIAWGIWSPWTGLDAGRKRGPERLRERFASSGL